jgi:hypothetical protein
MEAFGIFVIGITVAIFVYMIQKMVKFYLTDNSANRYTYETVIVDGEKIEKVNDALDPQ